MQDINLLASVALFSELYNSKKYQGVQDVIAEFIKGAIVSESRQIANSTEIKTLLDKVFGFKIPESVITSILRTKFTQKGLAKREKGHYTFEHSIFVGLGNFNSEVIQINHSHDSILSNLISFVERKEKGKLNETEKENLIATFHQFLLGNEFKKSGTEPFSEKYSNLVSSFVVSNEENPLFVEELNSIKEGLILYQGIKYTADINDLGRWDKELTIYLGAEHLFSALGYNGSLYQEIFNDFYKIIDEINKVGKKPKDKIHLKYFEETKAEIDNFFFAAEAIKNGVRPANLAKPAMKYILDSCKTIAEIKEKRIRFDLDLRTKRIILDNSKPDINAIIKYNVESPSILETLKATSEEKNRSFSEEDYQYFSKLFTRINYFRKGENNKPFEEIGYIFMTNSSFATYLARNANVKFEVYDVPFAADIEFITTKFWFQLNKGFADGHSLPKSSDVISKAKIILSSQLESKVYQKFQALKEEFKIGNLSKEEAQQRNVVFRDKPLKPEEITAENIDDSLNFLLDAEKYYENTQQEKIHKEELISKTQLENERLRNELQSIKDAEQREIERQQIVKLQQQKAEYIEDKWNGEKQKNNGDLRFSFLVFILNTYLAILPIFLASQDFRTWLFSFNSFWQYLIVISFPLIILVEIFGRSYLFDKDRIKNGWKWLWIVLSSDKKFEFEQSHKELSEKEFTAKFEH